MTVTGANLTGATTVDFGTTAGTSIVVNGGGASLTVTSPAEANGTIDVTVITPGGTSAVNAPADHYQFVANAAPTVTNVSPSAGPTGGATSVTVTGTNLTGETAVDFGATPGTGVVVNGGGTSLTVNSPAEAAGHGRRDGHNPGRNLGYLGERQVHLRRAPDRHRRQPEFGDQPRWADP